MNESEKQTHRKQLNDKIAQWQNRAWMAHIAGHIELVRQALERKHNLQVELAELDGTEPPEPDNPWAFGRDGTPPGMPPIQPSGVPRRPLPSAGGTTISLPLPEPDEESESDA